MWDDSLYTLQKGKDVDKNDRQMQQKIYAHALNGILTTGPALFHPSPDISDFRSLM